MAKKEEEKEEEVGKGKKRKMRTNQQFNCSVSKAFNLLEGNHGVENVGIS